MSQPHALEIFGRPDSSAVARVMWTVGELGLPHVRHDVGGTFGGTDTADYRAMNPSGRIPVVRLASGEALWESNAIIRYLAATFDSGGLMPADAVRRAQAEAWMDWSADYQKGVSAVRKAYKAADANEASVRLALQGARATLDILEHRLHEHDFIMGDRITIADLSLGVWAHRWFRSPEDLPGRPVLAATLAWHRRLMERPAFLTHVVQHVSAGAQRMGGG